MRVSKETSLGIFHRVMRDGVQLWTFECPRCHRRGTLDEDQWDGKVSVECATPGCTFHETHDYKAALTEVLVRDMP